MTTKAPKMVHLASHRTIPGKKPGTLARAIRETSCGKGRSSTMTTVEDAVTCPTCREHIGQACLMREAAADEPTLHRVPDADLATLQAPLDAAAVALQTPVQAPPAAISRPVFESQPCFVCQAATISKKHNGRCRQCWVVFRSTGTDRVPE